jgi:hypothetical protein
MGLAVPGEMLDVTEGALRMGFAIDTVSVSAAPALDVNLATCHCMVQRGLPA